MAIPLPFIKLLRSPNSGYFYDVGKNEIIRVDDKVFNFLQCLILGKETRVNNETLSVINLLKRQGYLSENRPSIIEHPYTQYLQLFLERKLEKITLQLTQQCNFRCKYCIYSEDKNLNQRSHSSKRMTWELAKNAVDFFWEHSVDSPKVDIGFYGGEPLLEFELLQKVTEYAELRFKGRPLTFTTTINGSLLTDKIVEYFINHNIGAMVSLDGPKEIHDMNRVFINGSGTFDTVMTNIKSIHKKYPDFSNKLKISMVMDPNNDFDCINSVTIDINEINFTNLNAAVVDNLDQPVTFSDKYVQQSEYKYFLALLSNFGYIPKNKVSPISNRLIDTALSDVKRMMKADTIRQNMAPAGTCIPGQIRLFVNADGDLFPCERVNESDVMKIGTLDTGFDYNKARELLNIGSLTSEECKNCWAIRHCIICAKMADDGKKLSPKIKISNCLKSQNSVMHKLRAMILIREMPEYISYESRE